MKKCLSFLKREPVFVISFFAALVSALFIPPDRQWLAYFDFRTLSLLYCLMVVVAGFRSAGLFDSLARTLTRRAGSVRLLGMVLVGLSFFSALFITNDVALLTFVPFAAVVFTMAGESGALLPVVVLQAVAANLGSMLLPVGNPQNLYIQSHYDLSMDAFLRMTGPAWLASLVLLAALCFLLPGRKTQVLLEKGGEPVKRDLAVFAGLFVICLLVVFRLISWPIMLLSVVVALAFYRPSLLKKADFLLLLTFVCFFIFSGNAARIPSVRVGLQQLLGGHEFWVTLGLSQVISNVPATLLLANFTDSAKALLLGADIGGLGTPIASLASLIALKLYSQTKGARMGRFAAFFLLVNAALLAVLALIFHC
ncbi:MAG: citrate transporter [Oscillospiraceae bacterium]|nr:citrate transporter [Oscillospiraceae bacterium]